jgi:hypothetical protein
MEKYDGLLPQIREEDISDFNKNIRKICEDAGIVENTVIKVTRKGVTKGDFL